MPLPLLKSLMVVLKLNFELQMPLPMPLSVIQILCGSIRIRSTVVASKVVVVKKAVTRKLVHEADNLMYIPSVPLNSNLFETMARRLLVFFACSAHWKLGHWHESKIYRL
jgi:hypothetical protein